MDQNTPFFFSKQFNADEQREKLKAQAAENSTAALAEYQRAFETFLRTQCAAPRMYEGVSDCIDFLTLYAPEDIARVDALLVRPKFVHLTGSDLTLLQKVVAKFSNLKLFWLSCYVITLNADEQKALAATVDAFLGALIDQFRATRTTHVYASIVFERTVDESVRAVFEKRAQELPDRATQKFIFKVTRGGEAQQQV